LILPICTGMLADRRLVDEQEEGVRILRLNYSQRSVEDTWTLAQNGAACASVLSPSPVAELLGAEDTRQKVPLLRFLVEDTLGWPTACIQLGAELVAALEWLPAGSGHTMTAEILRTVEERTH
jgi:hypothetical protein